MSLQTLLLAAGSSRRFGSDKLIAPLADGTPVIASSARTLCAAGCRVLAILRPHGDQVANLLAAIPCVAITRCPDADFGLGHSLAWGVGQSSDSDGWLVCLGDMPFLRPESVRSVVEALEGGASIAAPVHKGRRGHPVGFARGWRNHLLELEGDRGGQAIIRANPQALTEIPLNDPGVLRDLDLPEDLGG